MLSPGTVFATDFTVESTLSAGGMGQVYVVTQKSTGRRRALKLMHAELVRDPKLRERFALEAQVGARIDSEHVVEVIAAGVDASSGEPYLVMELLEGETLAAHLQARGALPAEEALLVLRQLGHALRAAHASGVVHRDLKPENVFLSKSRRADAKFTVKVLDFGIAKLLAESGTSHTAQMGTPQWMAPEQTEPGAAVSPATDVWALGLIAFFALAGRPYWLGSASGSAQAILREVLVEPMAPASQRSAALGGGPLPFGFDTWFAKATARAAEERWPEGGAALAALEPILATTVSPANASGITTLGTPASAAFAAPVGAALPAPAPLPATSTTQPAQPAPPNPPQPTWNAQPMQAPPSYGPPPHGAPPSYAPPPYGAPPPNGPAYGPGPYAGAAAKPSLLGRYWPVALGLVAVAATGTFALTRATKDPPRASRDRDDDDDDRRARPSRSATGVESAVAAPSTGAVTVEMYVMSQCPYAVQVENTFKEVSQKLGPEMTLKLDYIGTNKSGELGSMHGPAELMGDRVQICAMQHTPKWFDLVLCQNETVKEMDTNWTACAGRLGIPTAPIAKCIESESTALLSASFQRSVDRGAKGSPTIYIAGKKYEGGRKSSDFLRAICNAHGAPAPAACSELPVAPAVAVTMLSDARCTDCSSRTLDGYVGKIGNPTLSKVDYGTPEGKRLFDEIKPTNLPALVFDASLDGDADAFHAFEKQLRGAGKYRVISSGTWNPACADDGGCALDECKQSRVCRPEAPKQLDLFLMSQCPFAAKGLLALKEVLDNFQRNGEKLDVRLHYIGTGDAATGLKSMHGEGEVAEDLRQVCAIEHFPRNLKFLDYIMCRANDYKSEAWETCTGSNGIDAATIRTCSTGAEGKRLLAASFAYSAAEGASASPTWFTNARYKFSGIDAETIKHNICEKNRLKGCATVLSGPPPRP